MFYMMLGQYEKQKSSNLRVYKSLRVRRRPAVGINVICDVFLVVADVQSRRDTDDWWPRASTCQRLNVSGEVMTDVQLYSSFFSSCAGTL